jgi:hypothetical protein
VGLKFEIVAIMTLQKFKTIIFNYFFRFLFYFKDYFALNYKK